MVAPERIRFRSMEVALLLIAMMLAIAAEAQQDVATPTFHGEYYGNYRLADDHWIGINPFIMDDGQTAVLMGDYSSGAVRRLFKIAGDGFVMGAGFNNPSPTELTLRFVRDQRGAVTGVTLRAQDGSERFAQRVALKREDVVFEQADARLSGTLMTPATEGPHPVIILLHGSGPLTRYSFGPYPHFFTSLGFAVLIYDKRGAGQSSGLRMDASTATVMKPAFYPDDLAKDALAALQLLRQRDDIDPKRIGLWGSSEGGMLAMHVASRSKDVAFAINSSGFMEPLWETLRYQVRAVLEQNGVAEHEIRKEAEFIDLWLRVAQTGQGWEEFRAREQRMSETEGGWFFQSRGKYTSLEQLQWDWNHVLSFDPLRSLAQVTCPVLAVFGEQDPLTPAARTASNMRRVLTEVGHRDFTIRIFPKAGHSLSELPSRNRMAPGVFDTLREWLLERTSTQRM